MWHLSVLFITLCLKYKRQIPGLSLTDCTHGSNRAVVHTVHVLWRHSACLKGDEFGSHYVRHDLSLSFFLFGSSLGADCSNEKYL